MVYQKGDVLILPFPFTDGTAAKSRPAVVVSRTEYVDRAGDVVVAAITSREARNDYERELQEWQEAGLLQPSTVCAKLATVQCDQILHHIGQLDATDQGRLDGLLRYALDL